MDTKIEITKKEKKLIEVLCKTDNSLQKHYTPYSLCKDMISKLFEHTSKRKKWYLKFLVMFNLEFVYVFVNKFGIKPKNITFMSDSDARNNFAELLGVEISEYNPLELVNRNGENKIMKKQFDIIIGNPPCNLPKNQETKRGGGNWAIWPLLTKEMLKFSAKDGYLCFIHPPAWRKPTHKLWKIFSRDKQILYLRMLNIKAVKNYFPNTSSAADYYVVQNKKPSNDFFTYIQDENNDQINLSLMDKPFLPSSNFKKIENIIAKENESKCQVIYSYSSYETRKPWMSKDKTEKYKCPCAHLIKKKKNGGIICWYSSRNDKGHFGTSKVILNDVGILRPINDFQGEYGMTQHCFGLKTASYEESEQVVTALKSPTFQSIIKSCKWSGYEIDFEMFKYFRKDFWKQFI